ncbi:hypothetical protein AVEN_227705-1 [Araneus ventricosus]|uniref:Uncharacterized protein n=1 Tax=Araneus ventricosus TaxID=182803 RepID=A0A4Y2LZK2_ARAVE|nr:hypothetical protein AVEN_227705-1 [Araneus ventricosus]
MTWTTFLSSNFRSTSAVWVFSVHALSTRGFPVAVSILLSCFSLIRPIVGLIPCGLGRTELGREFYRAKHGVTSSAHSGTPDLSEHFGDIGEKSTTQENANLSLISLLGKKVRSNVRENST